jgi:succinate dehydrogenase / fumarate reductase membrane anchor subunit
MASVTRNAVARVKAQASIRAGADHWVIQRLTSVALVPLTLWFIVSAVSLSGASYEEARAWLAGPFNATAMLLLILSLFWHTQLGVQVIIEDYVHHEFTKFVSLMALKFAVIALGLACAVATLKIALGS